MKIPMDHPITISDTGSKALYRLAGVMALTIVLAGLVDAVTSMGIEARDNRTIDIIEWFTMFQTDRFAAFSLLGVINIITLSLGIPIYLAFNQAFRRERPAAAAPALAGLASILFFVGAAVYISSNTVFSLFALSRQYAEAPATQQPVLEAAGRALLAQGADLTPGTFIGLFFAQVAGLVIASLMLRGKTFGKWTGGVGLAGFSLMAAFFILTAFFPGRYDTAMLVAAPGGLCLMAYEIMLARRFFQLAR